MPLEMVRPERCRRHPKHKESKGVCPSCLRERLSSLSSSSSSLSMVKASSTTADSSLSSPPRCRDGEKAEPLKKSRSLAFVFSERMEEDREVEEEGRRKKKKGRSWFKRIVESSGKREDGGGLLHSKTMKEGSRRWVLFS